MTDSSHHAKVEVKIPDIRFNFYREYVYWAFIVILLFVFFLYVGGREEDHRRNFEKHKQELVEEIQSLRATIYASEVRLNEQVAYLKQLQDLVNSNYKEQELHLMKLQEDVSKLNDRVLVLEGKPK